MELKVQVKNFHRPVLQIIFACELFCLQRHRERKVKPLISNIHTNTHLQNSGEAGLILTVSVLYILEKNNTMRPQNNHSTQHQIDFLRVPMLTIRIGKQYCTWKQKKNQVALKVSSHSYICVIPSVPTWSHPDVTFVIENLLAVCSTLYILFSFSSWVA